MDECLLDRGQVDIFQRVLGKIPDGANIIISQHGLMHGQEMFKQDAGVPLKDETHGGEDVAILAKGPHAHLFAGVLQQK